MRDVLARLRIGVRVSWASSTAFATLGTAVVTLLVLPLFDVLFDVTMGSDLSAPNLERTGYAAALVALAVSVAGGVVAAAPVSGTVGALDGSGAGGLARDLLAAAVWAGVGLAVTRRAVSALRDGRRYDVV